MITNKRSYSRPQEAPGQDLGVIAQTPTPQAVSVATVNADEAETTVRTCACGCGAEVTRGGKWKRGHHNRVAYRDGFPDKPKPKAVVEKAETSKAENMDQTLYGGEGGLWYVVCYRHNHQERSQPGRPRIPEGMASSVCPDCKAELAALDAPNAPERKVVPTSADLAERNLSGSAATVRLLEEWYERQLARGRNMSGTIQEGEALEQLDDARIAAVNRDSSSRRGLYRVAIQRGDRQFVVIPGVRGSGHWVE